MTLAINDDAKSSEIGYRSAVERFGRPLLLVSAKKDEAMPMAEDMARHVGPGTHIVGHIDHGKV